MKIKTIGLTFILPLLIAVTFSVAYGLQAYAQCSSQDECKEELEKIDEEIKKLEGDIKKEDSTQKTISGEINKLTGEINKTATEIKVKDNLIGNIRSDIVRKEKSLNALNEKLRREKESLEKILRKRYELGDATLLEVILSSQDLSEFYEDAPRFSSVQSSLSDSFEIIDDLKVNIYHEKSSLEKKKEQENDVKYGLVLEKNKIEGQKDDKDQALFVSKSREASYEGLKKEREAEAKKIRAKIISFQGGWYWRKINFIRRGL